MAQAPDTPALRVEAQRWLEAEPDADMRAELAALVAGDADELAERGEGDPPNVDPVDLDGSLGDVVEPRHEVRHRRLASAARPDSWFKARSCGSNCTRT